MAEKVQVTPVVVEKNETLERAKGFWARYSKPIIIIGSVVILVLGGYYGYKHLIQIPKEEKASEAIFPAEKLFVKITSGSSFGQDTVGIILNGSKPQNITGLLSIISKYSGTDAANRAEYMAGACYLHLKQFDKAISHLKDFDGNGANQVQSKAYTMLGHAYAEQKKTDDALSYYKKAADVDSDDDGIASEALFMAGGYAEAMGKTEEAIKLFQKLKDKYAGTQRVMSGDADKYLAKLGVTK